VIALFVFFVLVGFLLGDTIQTWRVVWREVRGQSIVDLRRPLSVWCSTVLVLLAAMIWLLGAQGAL
jgi:hypothetical protein